MMNAGRPNKFNRSVRARARARVYPHVKLVHSIRPARPILLRQALERNLHMDSPAIGYRSNSTITIMILSDARRNVFAVNLKHHLGWTSRESAARWRSDAQRARAAPTGAGRGEKIIIISWPGRVPMMRATPSRARSAPRAARAPSGRRRPRK